MRLLAWSSSSRRPRRPFRTLADVWVRQRVPAALPVALACAWLARPTAAALAAGAAIAALGLAVRAIAASRLDKNASLATSGPYAATRHPLYLGSVLVAAGLLTAARSLPGALLGASYLTLFYPATIAREERKLRARHGAAFDAWVVRVPRFWPRLVSPRTLAAGCSWARYRRNREYRPVVAVALCVALLALKLHAATGARPGAPAPAARRTRATTDLKAGVFERGSIRRGTSAFASG
jgi:protein-S-isoprenylcysteine O-methyltransferase Ste14